MKRLLLLLSCASLISIGYAQTQDNNRFGYIHDAEANSKIKVINTSLGERANTLPSFVDNTLNKYFPATISQIGGSCAQASGVGYVYTYELNRLLDRDAKVLKNNCSYMQMWNYLNQGKGKGSFTPNGWELIQDNGVVLSSDFKPENSTPGATTMWPTGYDKYYRGMHNRVESDAKFSPYPDGPHGEYVDVIPAMKQYLFDHNEGAKTGGLIIFTAYADPLDCDKNYHGPSNTKYESLIKFFPQTGGHAMTFAGYDDKVECDINGNGSIEEDEKGAFIAMNTWGERWGSKGRFYVPYKLIKLKTGKEGGTGTGSKDCFVVTPKVVEPKITFRVALSHTSRNDLHFKIGVAKIAGALVAEKSIDVKVMYHAGGDHNLRGIYGAEYNTIEVGIDASKLAEYVGKSENATYFLEVVGKTFGNDGLGEIIDCSLLDYRKDKNNPIEHMSAISNPKIFNNMISKAVMQSGTIKVKEGRTIAMDFLYSVYNKKAILSFCAIKDMDIKADLVDSRGDVVRNVFSGKISPVASSTKIDFKDLAKGKYAIKIVAPNQLIYKPFNIK